MLAANATGTKVSCFNGSNGTAIVTVSGGTSPYTYSWSNAATTQSISNLSAATYNVTVTDAKGCTANSSYQVTQPTLLTVSMTGTTATCIGSASATPAGGTSPYTYLWTNGATTQSISSIPAGTYTVTLTDAKSCTVSGSFTITGGNAINPTVALTQVSCFGLSNGRITVTNAGGPAPHTYNINGSAFQSNNVFSNLSPGTYVIGVKAANGCSDFITRTITQPTILTVALDSLRKPCGGVSNGRIYITPNGGTGTKIYNWTGPSGFTSTLQDPNNVATGNYNVMVTDANGCTVSKNVILPEWPPVTVSEVITNVGCRNGLNGAINVTITGGTNSGFTYAWTGPNVFTATTEDISGLMAGTYRIAITDTSSGCTSQKLIVVTQPAAVLNLSTASTNVNGCASLSTITATGTGGTLPYQYKIDNGAYQSSGLFSGLNAASYTLLVKDANGCTNSKLVSITDNGSDEYETNNTKTQAKTIATGTPIFARIATAADVADWFKFTTVNAGNFTLMLTHISASFTFNIYPAGNNTTALVPTNTTATTKQYALAANTTYYIGVTGGSSYTCYNLSIAPSAAALFEQPLYVNTKNEQSPIEISRLPVVVSKLSAVTYPNPHQGNFTIQINSPQSGISTIQLVDAEGRIINAVNKMLLTGISNKFNFNNIHQSILFYKITIGKLITTGKIVRPN